MAKWGALIFVAVLVVVAIGVWVQFIRSKEAVQGDSTGIEMRKIAEGVNRSLLPERDQMIRESIDKLGKESFPDNPDVTWSVLSTTHQGAYSLAEAEATPATVGYPRFKFVLYFQTPKEPIVTGCYALENGDWALLFENPKSPPDWKALAVQ